MRSLEAVEALIASLPADARDQSRLRACDVMNPAGLRHAVDEAASVRGRLDGVLDTDNATWEQQLSLKVGSVLNLFRAAQPWLEKSDLARAAVANLGRSLAVELARRIGVAVVNLGAIHTGRQRACWERLGSGQTFREWAAAEVARREILLGRFGRPDEVAAVVTFLLSPRAGYITGTSLDVAGGSHGRA